ncbi:hypothetical protein [Streptomyces sp. NPDC059819]|uniref:hypothetical protein n=1 Tax=Streptomyces sp. NPDC059819 TaxID=3346963 RepID=UPI003663B672
MAAVNRADRSLGKGPEMALVGHVLEPLKDSCTLSEDHIAQILEGTLVPDWDSIRHLVQLLDGEPSFFQPLWKTAATRHGDDPDGSCSAPPAQPPAVRTPGQDHPGRRLSDLLAAFSPSLTTPAPAKGRDTQTPPARPRPTLGVLNSARRLLTPIPAVTHWRP